MRAPRIAVTVDSQGPGKGYTNYFDRLVEAGAEPVVLVPGTIDPMDALDGIDGVLIPGGTDVDPARYGEQPLPELLTPDAGRDDLEIALVRAALERDLPLLAICRGFQVLNVACGGRLLQHIPDDSHRALENGRGPSRFHDVTITLGTLLAEIAGAGTRRVNSRHHQAVLPGMIAPGLLVSATSPDGLIEGLESPGHRYAIGVQWHPERPEIAEDWRPLFAGFVAAARAVIA